MEKVIEMMSDQVPKLINLIGHQMCMERWDLSM